MTGDAGDQSIALGSRSPSSSSSTNIALVSGSTAPLAKDEVGSEGKPNIGLCPGGDEVRVRMGLLDNVREARISGSAVVAGVELREGGLDVR